MAVRVEHVMGMPIVVEIRDVTYAAGVVDAVFDWFRWVDEVFSTYRADSEVSRINRGELALADAHPLVTEVFSRCEQLRAVTDGFFDARAAAADVIDPSGLVKGWSVDRAAGILERAGVRSYAVNAGGDMRVNGGSWRIGIQHPLERQAVARVIEVDELAVATSGEYERGWHVLDPHTGAPRRPLGHRRGTGSRHERRLCHGSLRHGGGTSRRVDGAPPRLRRADDPRGRARPRDCRLPGRSLSPRTSSYEKVPGSLATTVVS